MKQRFDWIGRYRWKNEQVLSKKRNKMKTKDLDFLQMLWLRENIFIPTAMCSIGLHSQNKALNTTSLRAL